MMTTGAETMTPDEMRAIRLRVAPDLSQSEFGRRLGYRNRLSYNEYERGRRECPPLLSFVLLLLDERGSLPNWMSGEPIHD